MKQSFTAFVVLSSVLSGALAATYSRSANIVGNDFYSAFSFEAIADPTAGRVNYVDQATAQSLGLVSVSGNTFTMRADDTTVLTPSGPGRNSVRIKSNAAYSTHVAVIDASHLPQGCGTWPAFWETMESDWPNSGEVDIGVNDQSPNTISLHVGEACSMPASRDQTGTADVLDCDVNTDGNSGCGVSAPTANSFGPSFNAAGGGIYAMERTTDFIKVWFWAAGTAPSDVGTGAATVDTDNWGTPTAYFPNTSCDLSSAFGPNNIIINLTFCGDWAGVASVFNNAGCPGDCVDYVNNNPSAFTNAYWDINAVRVYE